MTCVRTGKLRDSGKKTLTHIIINRTGLAEMRGPVLWLQHTSSTPDTSTRRPVCPQCFRAHLHPVVSMKLKQRQLWPCKIFLWLWLCRCATSKSLFIYFIEVFFYLTFRGPAFSVVANLFWFQYSDTVLYTQLLYFSRLFDYDHAVKNAKQVSMSEKRYLPTVLESNNFTIKYLLLSKAVLKKLNCIKICLYQKLNWLRRTRTLYKLRK